MMQIIKKYKTALTIFGVLLVVFIIYSYFVGGNQNNNNTLLSTNIPVNNNPIGQAFINQLNTLQNIKLDTALFNDPRFQDLVDISQPIPDQPQGRPNPFAPIGRDEIINPTVFPIESGASSNIIFGSSATSSTPRSGR